MNQLFNKIKILHSPTKNEPYLIIDKPRGLPSAPLFLDDECALTFAIQNFPEIKNVKGKKSIEAGLVHRIDTETRGLLLIATNQEFYDKICLEQTNGRFYKTYSAYCDGEIKGKSIKTIIEGFPKLDPSLENKINSLKKLTNESSLVLTISSTFRPYGQKNKEVRPVNEFSGKAAVKKSGKKVYITEIILKKEMNGFLAQCKIKEGYRHQVRCHLAWIGLPIKGDILYNRYSKKSDNFLFYATGLEFCGKSYNLPKDDIIE